MTVWETVTWDVARAGGLTAYALLTAAVIVGLALSLKYQSPRWPRLINSEWHNYLTLLSTVFLGVHVLAVAVDPDTHYGLTEILVPLASHYRPFWMALGIVGLYLGIAIGISTWIRPLIGYQLWRRLHVLTLVVYALATVHGIFTGTDTLAWWGWSLYICSIVPVAILTAIRLLGPEEPAKQRETVASPVARR
ncbi:MAG: ferric reductase-like transmembrane domain-containing protein [Ktedonobacterales bacterium]